MSGFFSRPGVVVLLSLVLAMAVPAWGVSVPAQNLDPGSATIRLDSSFQSDAWLVYTYDIDVDGAVSNAAIKYSNGVLEVEQAVLQQGRAMRFRPATNNGSPVKVSAGPVTYTWILDKPRELSPGFDDMYREAWAFYAEENYDAAHGIADQLKAYPGRNAMEEVKYRILAASLASRRQDNAGELQHLKRGGSAIASDATGRFRQSEQAFRSLDDLPVAGELSALYPGGPGSWKTGLSRQRFALSDVQGRVGAVFLVCAGTEKQLRYPTPDGWSVPPGWTQCLIEVSGDAGTRLVLNQYASGR